MKNQFFYTKKEGEIELKDSFNVNKVIRSFMLPDQKVIVILDDFNERVMEEPDINTKTNKVVGVKKIRQTVQSEIHLSKEDGERFLNLLNIEINE